MVRLALLRHGHTAWNRAGRIQGRSDIALDETARAELAARSLPPDWTDADLVSSPLARAVETAKLVAKRPPQPVVALQEMHWGAWEGQFGKELLADPACAYRDIEDWGMDFCPPAGESITALSQRCLAWAETLDRDTLAVCHIGVMRVLLAAATGWRFEGPSPFAVKRNRLYILTRSATGWTLDPNPTRLMGAPSCAS